MTAPAMPVICVSGTHREVGLQLGEACAAAVRSATAFDGGEIPRDGRSMSEQLDLASEYRRVTAEALPYLVVELDAVAEAADVDPVRVFAASIEEIWTTGDAAAGTGASRLGSDFGRCTDLVAGPPATANQSVLIAHNNDLDASVEPNLAAVEWSVEGEPRVFTIGVGPWISVGWNEAGLVLSGNELAPNDNRVGVPRLLLVREQLRQTSMVAAVDAALHPARASAYNTIFALPDGEVVNVEGSATDGVVTTLSRDGTLVHANHYVCDAMLGYEDDHAYAEKSARRYARGTQLLAGAAQEQGSVTPELLRGFLADHENRPDSICRHPDSDSSAKTVFWCITDVRARRVTYGLGNPCTSGAADYTFSGTWPQ
jgi:isopenicillin-N N-acyltransferase-like protein